MLDLDKETVPQQIIFGISPENIPFLQAITGTQNEVIDLKDFKQMRPLFQSLQRKCRQKYIPQSMMPSWDVCTGKKSWYSVKPPRFKAAALLKADLVSLKTKSSSQREDSKTASSAPPFYCKEESVVEELPMRSVSTKMVIPKKITTSLATLSQPESRLNAQGAIFDQATVVATTQGYGADLNIQNAHVKQSRGVWAARGQALLDASSMEAKDGAKFNLQVSDELFRESCFMTQGWEDAEETEVTVTTFHSVLSPGRGTAAERKTTVGSSVTSFTPTATPLRPTRIGSDHHPTCSTSYGQMSKALLLSQCTESVLSDVTTASTKRRQSQTTSTMRASVSKTLVFPPPRRGIGMQHTLKKGATGSSPRTGPPLGVIRPDICLAQVLGVSTDAIRSSNIVAQFLVNTAGIDTQQPADGLTYTSEGHAHLLLQFNLISEYLKFQDFYRNHDGFIRQMKGMPGTTLTEVWVDTSMLYNVLIKHREQGTSGRSSDSSALFPETSFSK